MHLYIIRHGETLWNREKRLQGRTNIDLSDEGERIARLTAEGMKDIAFTHIFSSPLNRAMQTAKILRADRDLPIVIDDRLIEVCFGDYEGKIATQQTDSNIDRFFKAPETYVAYGTAESFDEIFARANSFLNDVIYPLAEKEPDATVLISGHGAINRGLISMLMNIPVEKFWAGKYMGNCAVNIFSIEGDKIEHTDESIYYYDAGK